MFKFIKSTVFIAALAAAYINTTPEDIQQTIILVNPESAGILEPNKSILNMIKTQNAKYPEAVNRNLNDFWYYSTYRKESPMFKELFQKLRNYVFNQTTSKFTGKSEHIPGHAYLELFERHGEHEVAAITEAFMRNKKLSDDPTTRNILIEAANIDNTIVGLASNISKDDFIHYAAIFKTIFEQIFKENSPVYVMDYKKDGINAPRMHKVEFWNKPIKDLQPPANKKIILFDNNKKHQETFKEAFTAAGFKPVVIKDISQLKEVLAQKKASNNE